MSAEATALVEAAAQYALPGAPAAIEPVGEGLIHQTYRVGAGPGPDASQFLFQRINPAVFPDVPLLMDNVQRVARHAAGRTPELLSARDGRPYARDRAGGWWRVFRFVPGTPGPGKMRSPGEIRELARAFGAFQVTLAALPGPRLHELLPGFHDTPQRFLRLEAAVASDSANRAQAARAEITFAFRRAEGAKVLSAAGASGILPERLVHNDPKPSNLLFAPTGRAAWVLDLDTVMPGLAPFDFGDLVRTAAAAADEDEENLDRIAADPARFEPLARGFLEGTKGLLTAPEIDHLVLAGWTITLEQGVRFLDDHLRGDRYYRIARPGHNLRRARAQFALVRSLEAHQAHFERLLRQIAAEL